MGRQQLLLIEKEVDVFQMRMKLVVDFVEISSRGRTCRIKEIATLAGG